MDRAYAVEQGAYTLESTPSIKVSYKIILRTPCSSVRQNIVI